MSTNSIWNELSSKQRCELVLSSHLNFVSTLAENVIASILVTQANRRGLILNIKYHFKQCFLFVKVVTVNTLAQIC